MKKIIIFPHAGGSGSFYRTIIKETSEIKPIYLDYPGHLFTLDEPLAKTMEDLTVYLLKQLFAQNDILFKDLIFFGHSMGGLVAYEVAKKINANYNTSINKLIISAALPKGQMRDPIRLESIDEMWDYFSLLQNVPSNGDENQELGELLFPVIRQDLQLLYEYKKDADDSACLLKNVKPYIFVGKNDAGRPHDYKKWQFLFQKKCQFHFFEGGHFYFQEDALTFYKIMNEII